jgi:hypothetical protein
MSYRITLRPAVTKRNFSSCDSVIWPCRGGGSFGYADPARRLGIGFAKNYFNYNTGGAVNQGRPPRSASNVVTEAVFNALGLRR